ncbi:hypothetical protein XpopCFBP1817_20135, partial [Xanthomonas populi]
AITHTARTRLQPDGHGLKNVGIPQILVRHLDRSASCDDSASNDDAPQAHENVRGANYYS